MFEQVPDLKTLQITSNTKNLKMLVYEMLTNKCKELFNSQSTEEIKNTRRVFTKQCNVVDIFIKFMGNIPPKPINMA